MNIIFTKILGFLIGLFILITLLFYLKKINYIENIKNETSSEIIEHFTDTSSTPDYSIIPFSNKKYMCISTFKNKISINDQKWYDDDVDLTSVNINSANNNLFFNFNNLLQRIPNETRQGSSSVNIKNVTLKGPLSFNFANNNNFELTNCSIFFTLKINATTPNSNNILFEMLADTNVNSNGIYTPVSIVINIIDNGNNTSTINITIGNILYTNSDLTNITNRTISDISVNLVGLIISNTDIIFIFNNNTYNFKNTYTDKILLGTNNIIINKNGNIDANLYNFIYYKYTLLITDIPTIKSYNNYYISGLYEASQLASQRNNEINDLLLQQQQRENEIRDLQNQINLLSIAPVAVNNTNIQCPVATNNNTIKIDPLVLTTETRKSLKKILKGIYNEHFISDKNKKD